MNQWRIGGVLLSVAMLTACAGGAGGQVSGAEVIDPKPAEYRAAFNAPRGPVRMSMVGTRPGFPLIAIVETDADTPLTWTLKQGDQTLQSDMTTPFGYHEGSGASVHHIRMDAIEQAQTDLRVHVEGIGQSQPFDVTDDAFTALKYDTLRYFYHNRVGIPIEAEYAGGALWARPTGHTGETMTCFEGEDLNGVYWPGCDYSLTVAKGWYDAGDHSKYTVNTGIAVWTLQHFAELGGRGFADGQVRLPESGNGISDLLDEARWAVDFMMAMQVPDGARAPVALGDFSANPGEIQVSVIDAGGMAHHKAADAKWPTLPLFPHDNQTERVLHAPSVTATLHLAIVSAQCARLYARIDPQYAAKCRSAAERAYAAAKRVPDAYSYANFDGSGPYDSTDARNEVYWAAVEMYLMTGDAAYKDDVLAARARLQQEPMSGARSISWSDTQALGTIALARLAPDEDLHKMALASLRATADDYLAQIPLEGYAIGKHKEEWAWGSVGELANRGLLLATVYDLTGDVAYRNAALSFLDYILGRNPRDISYIAGHGEKAVQAVHHRHWGRAADPAFPPPPPGAMSGGPNTAQVSGPVSQAIIADCHAQTCFADHIDAYELNEVAINWQAAAFWLTAWADQVDRN